MTYPISIERDEYGAIRITWDDQAQTMWTPLELRQRCPCATCREKKREPVERPRPTPRLPVITAAETRPLRIESMQPIGNYAYNIRFSDGHASGIFTFEILKKQRPFAHPSE